jgi:hypothetical protein
MMPTMVSMPERSFLRDWVALQWLGFGDIVEIGAFAGGSATAILQGMEATRHKGTLHVYDTFTFPKGGHESVYRSLIGIQGDDFRKVFDGIMREWGDRLRVVQADASSQKWQHGRIEMLHLDCSISQEFHEKVALEFYPSLMPNGSLVHQDFGYENAKFIPEMMAKLEPWFRRVATIETTAYFAVEKTPTKAELQDALFGKVEKAA